MELYLCTLILVEMIAFTDLYRNHTKKNCGDIKTLAELFRAN